MIESVGIVVPVHDEQGLLRRCLAGLATAVERLSACSPAPRTHVVVALDDCADASARIAHDAGVHTVSLAARNVGIARATGVRRVFELERGTTAGRVWLCTTDADSVVPAHWLTRQLSLAAAGAAAVVGTIEPDDWCDHEPWVAGRWASRYRQVPGHDHVHGANLGCNGAVYESVGGFPPHRSGEDAGLVRALEGHQVRRVNDPVVVTSARRHGRAPGGFAAYLRNLS